MVRKNGQLKTLNFQAKISLQSSASVLSNIGSNQLVNWTVKRIFGAKIQVFEELVLNENFEQFLARKLKPFLLCARLFLVCRDPNNNRNRKTKKYYKKVMSCPATASRILLPK